MISKIKAQESLQGRLWSSTQKFHLPGLAHTDDLAVWQVLIVPQFLRDTMTI